MTGESILVRAARGSLIALATLLPALQACSQEAGAERQAEKQAEKQAKGTTAGAIPVDPSIAAYRPIQGVSGNLKSIGSDTMNNEMANWAEGFRKFYPSVKIEIE